jgi:hypothetical protein
MAIVALPHPPQAWPGDVLTYSIVTAKAVQLDDTVTAELEMECVRSTSVVHIRRWASFVVNIVGLLVAVLLRSHRGVQD